MERLTDEEKKELLSIARTTLEKYLKTGEIPLIQVNNKRLSELKLGCFVTLKRDGELRGCIGNFSSKDVLYKNVQKMAIASATEDPRFSSVSLKELASLRIEVSVLYPLIKIKDIDEILVGRDGLYIVYGYYSGVLLPQVATEYGWDKEEFLSHTCLKAGLSADSWKKLPLEIYRFEADVFGEEDVE